MADSKENIELNESNNNGNNEADLEFVTLKDISSEPDDKNMSETQKDQKSGKKILLFVIFLFVAGGAAFGVYKILHLFKKEQILEHHIIVPVPVAKKLPEKPEYLSDESKSLSPVEEEPSAYTSESLELAQETEQISNVKQVDQLTELQAKINDSADSKDYQPYSTAEQQESFTQISEGQKSQLTTSVKNQELVDESKLYTENNLTKRKPLFKIYSFKITPPPEDINGNGIAKHDENITETVASEETTEEPIETTKIAKEPEKLTKAEPIVAKAEQRRREDIRTKAVVFKGKIPLIRMHPELTLDFDSFILLFPNKDKWTCLSVGVSIKTSSEVVFEEIEQRKVYFRGIIFGILNRIFKQNSPHIYSKETLKKQILSDLNMLLVNGTIENIYLTNFLVI